MKHHPAASLFPMLGENELRILADDIKEHGQLESAIIFEGTLLDGRNREAACKLAKVALRTRTLRRCDSPTAYVISANLHRRHLTPAQKGWVAAEALPMFEAEAKASAQAGRVAGGKKAGRGRSNRSGDHSSQDLSSRDENKRARARAAKATGTSEHAVRAVVAIREKAPEVKRAIDAGATVADAKRLAQLAPKQRNDEGHLCV